MALVSVINRMFRAERESISDYLPYRFWDDANKCYDNYDNTFGWLWQLTPLVFQSDATVNNIELILNAQLPEESVVQFILFADPRIRYHLGKLIHKERGTGSMPYDLMEFTDEWIVQYAKYIDKHSNEGFSDDIPVRIRDFRLFCAIKIPYKNYQETIDQYSEKKATISSLLASCHFQPVEGEPAALIDMVRYLLNPSSETEDQTWKPYNPYMQINEQILERDKYTRWHKGSNNGIGVDDKHCGVYTVGSYPDTIEHWENMNLLGDIFNNDLHQIPVPFLINLTYVKHDFSQEIRKKAGIIMTQKGFGAGRDRLERKKEEFRKAVNQIDDQIPINGVFCSVVTYCADEDEKSRIQGVLESIWKKPGYRLLEERHMSLPVFLSSLPFGLFNDSKVRDRLKRVHIAPTKTIAQLVPASADWKGCFDPTFFFVSRRGQLQGMDLYFSKGNYNFSIAAESGAGKSVLACFIIMSYLRLGAYVRVIDAGRSYFPLCQLLGESGEYLEFSPESKICINPFSSVVHISEDLQMIMPFMEKMAKQKTGCDDYELNSLREAVVRCWNKYKNDSTPARVGEILMEDKKNDKKVNLGIALQNYGPGGEYGKWFDGRSTLSDTTVPLQVLELDDLQSDKHLRSLVLMYILYKNVQMMYLKKGRTGDSKMMIIIDEASDLFSDQTSNSAKFIKEAYQKARKHGGSIGTITQRVSDYYASELTKAMLANSEYWLFLSQKEEELVQLVKENRLNLSKFMLKYLSSVRTVPGKYSEVFIKTGDVSGIGRLFLDPFSYAMFTTEPNERGYIMGLIINGYSTKDAINEAVKTDFGRKLS